MAKDGKKAPKGYHYMPDGSLMKDSDMKKCKKNLARGGLRAPCQKVKRLIRKDFFPLMGGDASFNKLALIGIQPRHGVLD